MRTKARPATDFGVCLDNSGYSASLEVGKLYHVIPDPEASKRGYIRVVDESGEDYGYSAKRFYLLNVPKPIAHALRTRLDQRAHRPRKVFEPAARKMRCASTPRSTRG